MTNRPVSLLKRVIAASIDFIIIVLAVMFVSEFINLTPLIDKYTELANDANSLRNSIGLSLGLGDLVVNSGTLVYRFIQMLLLPI